MKSFGHLRMEEIRLAPGQEWQEPAAGWCFLRVSAGAAYWLDTLKPRALSEGEVIILGPTAKGTVRASQLNEVVLHGFSFAPGLLCGFFTVGERQFLEQTDSVASLAVRFLPSTHPIAAKFALIAGEEPRDNSLSQRVELLGMVTSVLEEEISRQQRPRSRSTSALRRFEQMIAHMPDVEITNHTPAQLANLCGCSARHFNRVFRSCFGISVRARQTELRLLKARQLITDTDKKIMEVAVESGYRNLSLFNLLFKRQFGMTPSESRRKWQKK